MVKSVWTKLPLELKKTLLFLLIIQIIIVLFFVLCLRESKPIEYSECIQTSIIVEDKKYMHKLNEYNCRVLSNGFVYGFPNIGHYGEYTTKEIYDTIEIGERLDVSFVKSKDIFGEYNLIVDATNGNEKYIDISIYNEQKEKAYIITIVLFCIIEFVFILLFGSFVGFYCGKIKNLVLRFKKHSK